MKKTTLFLLVLVAIAFQTVAQQVGYLGQYHVNPYFINSSYAGIDEGVRTYAHHRNQWLGVEGAPVTSAFTADWKLGQNPMGLGLKIIRDESNVIGRTDIKLSYAYHFKINDEHNFSLGIGAGVVNNSILFNRLKVIDQSEAILLSNSNSQFAFDAEAGANYRFRNKLFLGFSAFQLTSPKLRYQNSIADEELHFDLVRHYIINGAYQFQIKESDFKIEPHALIRSTFGLPFQYEGGLSGIYDDKLRLNVDYRHEIGMAYSASYLLEQKYTFGYLYNADLGEFAYNSRGTHEIVLGIRFGKSKSSNYATKKELDLLRKENARLYEEVEVFKQNRNELERRLKVLEELKSSYLFDEPERSKLRDSLATNDISNGENLLSVIGIHSSLEDAKEHQRTMKRESGIDSKVVLDDSNKWFMVVASGKEVSENDPFVMEKEIAISEETVNSGGITTSNVESEEEVEAAIEASTASVDFNANYVVLIARRDKALAIKEFKKLLVNKDVMLVQNSKKTWYHVILKEAMSTTEAANATKKIQEEGIKDAWWTNGKQLTQ